VFLNSMYFVIPLHLVQHGRHSITLHFLQWRKSLHLHPVIWKCLWDFDLEVTHLSYCIY